MMQKELLIAALFLSVNSLAQDPGPALELSDFDTVGPTQWRLHGASAESGPGDEMSFLVSRNAYRDFRLSVELWVAADTNSGVLVRCSDPGEITPLNCFEINVWDNHPNQDFRTGSIVTLAKPLAHVDTAGQWSTIEIEVAGTSIIAVINGIETARLDSEEREEAGYIALQFGGGELVKFRNLRINTVSDRHL